MNLDETFINYYWNHMCYSRKDGYTDAFYKLLGCKTKEEMDAKVKEINLVIVKKVIEYDKSIEEYCAMYGGSIRKLKNTAHDIKNEYPDIFKQFRKCCREPEAEFYLYIKNIADEMVIKGREFDAFDYYYATRLDPTAFKHICKKILSPQQFREIEPTLTSLRVLGYYKHIDINTELNGTTIIKGYEISKEEKGKILQYLIEHNIPLHILNVAFRKYVAGDERLVEYVNQFQKRKKETAND